MEELELILEEPSGSARPIQIVSFGLPLPGGLITNTAQISVSDHDGRELLVQRDVLGVHPDGSPRWVFIQFVTSLEANQRKVLTIRFGEEGGPEDRGSSPSLVVRDEKEKIVVDTGQISFDLSKGGFSLPAGLKLDGDGPVLDGDGRGFRVVDGDGREFFTGLDRESQVSLLEAGPVRMMVHYQGVHRDGDGDGWLNYDVWLSACAGSAELVLQYRVLNLEDVPMQEGKPVFTEEPERVFTTVREMELRIETALGPSVQMLMGGDERPPGQVIQMKGEARIEQLQFDRYTLKGVKEDGGGGDQALGWASISDESGGVSAAIEEFAQNHPKGLLVRASGIQLDLYPSNAAPLDLPRGSAKTHTLFLRFHRKEDPETSLANALASLNRPTPILPAHWYARTRVLGDIFPPDYENYPLLERAMDEAFLPDRYGGMTGMLDVGDFGGASYKNNNEYDLSHCYFVLFARSGGRNYLRFMDKCTLHTMDQDFAHYSPMRLDDGGVYIHCGKHNDFNVQIDHLWVQGTLDRYFFFGDREALRIARRIGDNALLKVAESPYRRATERAAGWPMILLCAIYEATLEQKYLDGAAVAVETALDWQDTESGAWPHVLNEEPLYQGGVSFMTGVLLDGLAHYYFLTEDERVRESFLKGVDWLMNDARFPDGSFFWKASPRLRTPTATPLVFPAFAHAWQITGDRKYLEEIMISYQLFGLPRASGAMGDGIYLRSIFELLQAFEQAGMLNDPTKMP
ncbi:MAG: hypothetical protein QF473_21860 [Planctomycetota bacterium]|jgi:hypothetical protein|nr:hypothetical protein [Planctomycetota bacterium]